MKAKELIKILEKFEDHDVLISDDGFTNNLLVGLSDVGVDDKDLIFSTQRQFPKKMI